MASPPHLQVENLSCERQDRLLFENLSFEASAGQLIRVHGKNGSGKSTLLKTISGLLKPTAGFVNWKKTGIAALYTNYHKQLTYIGHKPAVKSELTVAENIRHLLSFRQQQVGQTQINQVLSTLSIDLYEDVEAGFLSQGQQRRISLSRLWLEDSELWILDEPYTALDKDAVKLVNTVMQRFLQAGNIVILTSHQDTDELEQLSQNIWLGN